MKSAFFQAGHLPTLIACFLYFDASFAIVATGTLSATSALGIVIIAMTALGVAAADVPKSTSRCKEIFFVGKVFDPTNPSAYLKSLAIKRAA